MINCFHYYHKWKNGYSEIASFGTLLLTEIGQLLRFWVVVTPKDASTGVIQLGYIWIRINLIKELD